MDQEHPVRLTIEHDDLMRTRVTVFFRLILAIPLFIWFVLWAIAVLFVAILNWFATLIGGVPPLWCHNFLTAFVRYSTHLSAYVSLTADPYPGFTGRPGSYPVDLQLPAEPQVQDRWKTGFRLILAIPAFLVDAALTGGGGGRGNGLNNSIGALWIGAFLGWWAVLFTGRMPEGLRDLNLYALRYGGQSGAYVLLVTERYPDADPFVPPVPPGALPHPVRLTADDELARWRLTVFFRVLLAIPHFIWLALWGIAAAVAAILGWFVTLFTGALPPPLHRFLGSFVRYGTHVGAYVFLTADPYPEFLGRAGSYPVDLHLPAEPEIQNRWKTGFRLILAVPAFLVGSSLSTLAFAAAFLGWFAALFTGRMPRGLRQAQLFHLRYAGQTYAYLALLTERYPFGSPAQPAEL